MIQLTGSANDLQKMNFETTLIVGRNECHIAPLIWPLFADKHETEQGLALTAWLIDRLHM